MMGKERSVRFLILILLLILLFQSRGKIKIKSRITIKKATAARMVRAQINDSGPRPPVLQDGGKRAGWRARSDPAQARWRKEALLLKDHGACCQGAACRKGGAPCQHGGADHSRGSGQGGRAGREGAIHYAARRHSGAGGQG